MGEYLSDITDSGRDSPLSIILETDDLFGFEIFPTYDDEDSRKVRTAANLLPKLDKSMNADCLRMSLKELLRLGVHDSVLSYLEENEAHRNVLSVMKHLALYTDIQVLGCQLLFNFMENSPTLQQSVIRSNVYMHLLRVANEHVTNTDVQYYLMRIFSLIVVSETARDRIVLDERMDDVFDTITVAITAFRNNADIQIYAFKCLQYLLADDPDQQEDFIKHKLQILFPCFSANEKNLKVIEQVFIIFVILFGNERLQPALLKENIPSMVVEILQDGRNQMLEHQSPFMEALLQPALELLSMTAKEDTVQYLLVRSEFVPGLLVAIMKMFLSNKNVQMRGLQILNSVVSALFGSRNITEKESEGLLEVVYLAMGKHLEDPTVLVFGCRTLSKLLEYKPQLSKFVGENADQDQIPVHTCCLGAILMHNDHMTVFGEACEAIYWLAADNDVICKLLMDKNTYLAIIGTMKVHRDNPTVMQASCRALRGLCIFCDDYKHVISACDNVLSILVDVITSFPHDVDAILEAISTIACLSSVTTIREQCLSQCMHHKFMDMLVNYSNSDLIHEVVLEALAPLASHGEGWGQQLLIDNGTIEMVCRTINIFPHNSFIQRKCLILLQLLASEKALRFECPCREVAAAIHLAITEHSSNRAIQVEACVAIQLCAEKSALISQLFVELSCQDALFYILEEFEDNQGVHDLASECLYVLGYVQGLKSQMLKTAAVKGQLAGIECLLEIGADINVGQGQDTVLFQACLNKDARMVKLLLKHGASDIHTSLKQSLQNETHIITGMLLRHVGYDKDGGIVSWSNLDLGDLQPEWFTPTFLGSLNFVPDETVTGRQLAQKIKASEMRRETRLRHVNSESDLPSSIQHRESPIIVVAERKRHNTEQFTGRSHYCSSDLEELFGRSRSDSQATDLYSQDNSVVIPSIDGSFSVMSDVVTSLADSTPASTSNNREVQEWRLTTLTGANVPYSNADPRKSKIWKGSGVNFSKVPWLRKSSLPKMRSGDSQPEDGSEITSFANSQDIPKNAMTKDQSYHLLPGLLEISPPDLRLRRRSSATDVSQESVFLENNPMDQHHSVFRGQHSLQFGSNMSKETTFRKRANTLGSAHQIADNAANHLYLSSNSISTLEHLVSAGHNVLKRFAALERLDLSKNSLSEIPDVMYKYLQRLLQLDLHQNLLQTFPVGALSLKLVVLDLSHNKVSDFNNLNLVTSFSLREFNLSYNDLSEFPYILNDHMPGLEHLSLAGNNMKGILDKPLKLKRLKRLDLSHNAINGLGNDFLSECVHLETLEIINNKLTQLPTEEVAWALTKLQKLKCKQNNLTEKEPFFIPKFILALPGLKSVDLRENELTGLPSPTLWKTQVIKEIVVSINKITKLNLDNAKYWSTLENFHIAHNLLQELPKEIGQLTSLSSLDFNHNKNLTTLPDELGRCSKIWEMPLDHLFLDLDPALLKGRVKDLIIYLHNKLKRAQRYYRMKMMVVGYADRGKSSLLRSLMKIRQPEHSTATVGVIVRDWKYDRKRHRKDVSYVISTWDFAGQEEFYSTHQCFLSNRALYLVVYDLSRGPDEIETLKPWLVNIQAQAPGCPVIVVGTHLDQVPTANRKDIIAEMKSRLHDLATKPGIPALFGIEEVDCTRDNTNIDKLRTVIKNVVDDYKIRGQPVMGQKIPASYVRLSDLITEEVRSRSQRYPVIRHRRLLSIVREANLDLDEEELPQAIRFLHESGILLHYEETALQMKDLYFIDPGWLCRMMAQIITIKEVNPFITEEGVLKKKNVKLLFLGKPVDGEVCYIFPPELTEQYLHLLEKFEVALPLNEEDLLIPSKLPLQCPMLRRPDILENSRLLRIYQMPYFPIGFWTRLISRLIVFSKRMSEQAIPLETTQPLMQYWRQGIYVCWSEDSFFLLKSETRDGEALHIYVPPTTEGAMLLGHIVDHVDALIDEWYPGLTHINPLQGRELLDKLVPCLDCGATDPHLFRLDELVQISESTNYVECPVHRGKVELAKLAPDVMLSDLEPEFVLDIEKLSLKEKPEYMLGDGGFGSVYAAKYRGQPVAVKTFNFIGDIHPHKMLRQEATILRRLRHPSVVSLSAVGLRPRIIIMEIAPLGSLGSLLKHSGKGISRGLQHRIAIQLAEGLLYLHQQMIVYRDLKPDNILIFNLSIAATINAKIADYGISRFTAPYGLTAQEGTPGYRAPEVTRGETYSFKADVFSFGITLYTMLTGGSHPFEELEYKNEMDRAISEGRPITPLTKRGCLPWPDMQEVISRCLEHNPDQRPDSKAVLQSLKSSELLCLKQIIPISKATTVECMAVRSTPDGLLELWIASGDRDCVQLSWVNLLDTKLDVKGLIFNDHRILCILHISNFVLVGSQSGRIWVYDAQRYMCKHSTKKLRDAVLSMQVLTRTADDDLLLAGLANGELAVFSVSELIYENHTNCRIWSLGHEYEPVKCLRFYNDLLYLTCGTKVFCAHFESTVPYIEKVLDVTKINESASSNNLSGSTIIYNMAVGKNIFLSKRSSSVVECWDPSKRKLQKTVNIADITGACRMDARITSMCLQNSKALWLGTGGGHLVLLDSKMLSPLVVTQRYTGSVRAIILVKPTELVKYAAVITGGLGFRSLSESEIERDFQYGCATVWEFEFAQIVKNFTEDMKKRQELVDKYSNL